MEYTLEDLNEQYAELTRKAEENGKKQIAKYKQQIVKQEKKDEELLKKYGLYGVLDQKKKKKKEKKEKGPYKTPSLRELRKQYAELNQGIEENQRKALNEYRVEIIKETLKNGEKIDDLIKRYKLADQKIIDEKEAWKLKRKQNKPKDLSELTDKELDKYLNSEEEDDDDDETGGGSCETPPKTKTKIKPKKPLLERVLKDKNLSKHNAKKLEKLSKEYDKLYEKHNTPKILAKKEKRAKHPLKRTHDLTVNYTKVLYNLFVDVEENKRISENYRNFTFKNNIKFPKTISGQVPTYAKVRLSLDYEKKEVSGPCLCSDLDCSFKINIDNTINRAGIFNANILDKENSSITSKLDVNVFTDKKEALHEKEYNQKSINYQQTEAELKKDFIEKKTERKTLKTVIRSFFNEHKDKLTGSYRNKSLIGVVPGAKNFLKKTKLEYSVGKQKLSKELNEYLRKYKAISKKISWINEAIQTNAKLYSVYNEQPEEHPYRKKFSTLKPFYSPCGLYLKIQEGKLLEVNEYSKFELEENSLVQLQDLLSEIEYGDIWDWEKFSHFKNEDSNSPIAKEFRKYLELKKSKNSKALKESVTNLFYLEAKRKVCLEKDYFYNFLSISKAEDILHNYFSSNKFLKTVDLLKELIQIKKGLNTGNSGKATGRTLTLKDMVEGLNRTHKRFINKYYHFIFKKIPYSLSINQSISILFNRIVEKDIFHQNKLEQKETYRHSYLSHNWGYLINWKQVKATKKLIEYRNSKLKKLKDFLRYSFMDLLRAFMGKWEVQTRKLFDIKGAFLSTVRMQC